MTTTNLLPGQRFSQTDYACPCGYTGPAVIEADESAFCAASGCASLLFLTDQVRPAAAPAPAPAAPAKPVPVNGRSLKFRQIGTGLQRGDQRDYDVIFQGYLIGTVGQDWAPAAREGDDPVQCFRFSTDDGTRHGEGRTRAAAVLNAFEGR